MKMETSFILCIFGKVFLDIFQRYLHAKFLLDLLPGKKCKLYCWETSKMLYICMCFPDVLQKYKKLKRCLFSDQTDEIIILCFLFVSVGNSLHVFQAIYLFAAAFIPGKQE